MTGAAVALSELSLAGQLGVFLAASAASSRSATSSIARSQDSVARDSLNERQPRADRHRRDVTADFVNGRGKVRIGDTVWLAERPEFAEGTPVVVRAVRGMRVAVEAAAGSTAA